MSLRDPVSRHEAPDFFSTQVSDARRFYLDLNPSPRERMIVVCGGCERCAPDYEIHRSGFPYHSLEFVARGTGSLVLGGKRHLLEPGTVFSYGPGIPQDIATDPKDRLVKYFVDFAGKDAGNLLAIHGPRPGRVARTSAPHEIVALFDDLIRNGLKDTHYSPRICAAILEHLILKIAETSVPTGIAETPAFATYERCRKHIQDHHLRLTTLDQIARECRVDPAYLCRLFQRYGRQTPYQLLLRLKMGHAAERLQAPGTLVKQVAAELGFSDPYHFSRTFKRVLGVSPKHVARLRRRK